MTTREQRAEALMAQGPIQNVRRIMELEDALTKIVKMQTQVPMVRPAGAMATMTTGSLPGAVSVAALALEGKA